MALPKVSLQKQQDSDLTEIASEAASKLKPKSMQMPISGSNLNISVPKLSPSWSPGSNGELSNPSSSDCELNFDKLIKSEDNESSCDRRRKIYELAKKHVRKYESELLKKTTLRVIKKPTNEIEGTPKTLNTSDKKSVYLENDTKSGFCKYSSISPKSSEQTNTQGDTMTNPNRSSNPEICDKSSSGSRKFYCVPNFNVLMQ